MAELNIPKVIYLDDEEINLYLFKTTFQNVFEVLTFSSPRAALEGLRENPEISVVITDMKMPEMSGVEFVREARKNFKDINYYLLTAYHADEQIEDAIAKNEIVKTFSKPFETSEIRRVILEHV